MYLDAEFQRQIVDTEWANRSETKLKEGLAKVQRPSVAISELGCRQSLCKLVATVAGEREGLEYSDAVRVSNVWEGPGVLLREDVAPPDRLKLTFFFAREGTAIPTQK